MLSLDGGNEVGLPESAPWSSYRHGNRLEFGGTRRPSRHFARWYQRQEMIPAKLASSHCVSVYSGGRGGFVAEGDTERR